jgi:hypothetical protein
MSKAPKDGGQAFPRGHFEWKDGMTLRDWFAGRAMAELQWYTDTDENAKQAEMAYRIADAMIAAREKGGEV